MKFFPLNMFIFSDCLTQGEGKVFFFSVPICLLAPSSAAFFSFSLRLSAWGWESCVFGILRKGGQRTGGYSLH